MDEFEQPELEMKALLVAVAELRMRPQHDVKEACQVLFTELLRDMRDTRPFITGDLKEVRLTARNLSNERVAKEADHLTRKMGGALAFDDQLVDDAQDAFTGIAMDGIKDGLERVRGHGANQTANDLGGQTAGAAGNRLV